MGKDLICGLHAVLTALQRHPEQVDSIWLNEERDDKRSTEIVRAARAAGVKLRRVPLARLTRLMGTAHHQGVVGRLCATPLLEEHDLAALLGRLQQTPLLLVLDGVQDPRNLGACLRCADGAGAHGVVLPRDRSTSLTASVYQAASGAASSVPVFQVKNLARTLEQLKDAGIWLIGASQDAQTELFQADLSGPLAVIMGGEDKGLRRLTRERCDALVRIPMHGSVSSLNVSVAAAIALYEVVRQRLLRDS
ncbi:MAG: 23S rRNA (guanosine(2251)-2'-O)-methyltransferase RlmB [Acidiferrobacterales bacterium]